MITAKEQIELNKMLIDACYNDNAGIIKLLLENHAYVNTINKDGWSPLHIICSVCCHTHIEIVQLLLKKGADVDAKNKNSQTPLHFACLKGNVHIVQLLIDNKEGINAPSTFKASLGIACYKGPPNIFKSLLEKGADISVTNANGNTPLHLACYKGHMEVVQLLLANGADVNVKNKNGDTPLEISYARGHTEIIKLLEEHIGNKMGQDNLNKLLIDDMVISIARDGGVDTVKMLTSKVDFKINMKNNEGNTMLYYACLDGDLDVVQLLIAKDADINITNEKGLAPIHAACIGNRFDIIEFLVESGADTTKKTGKSGLTAHDLVEFWNPKDQKSLDLLKSG